MPNWMNIIEDLVDRVTDIGSTMISSNSEQTLEEKCTRLLKNSGEATSLALSREILDDYKGLEDDDKLAFFQTLFSQFGVDETSLDEAITNWKLKPSEHLARRLHFATEPKSQDLIRQLNRAPGGTASLVRMRHDLLRLGKGSSELKSLDSDLSHLFSSWFNRGFLRLEVINWSTSAQILEKIIAYEAVHEIQGWDDLRRRVAEKDRRLYAFFHASLPFEPLIFVEVALTQETPRTIDDILAADRETLEPHEVSTAVFYSISNCQAGLRGISFGNFLIKQVVEELKRELPNLKRFITMSPVPGLRKWSESHLPLDNEQLLCEAIAQQGELLSKEFVEQYSPELNRLATHYLLEAKRSDGGPVDPVSRFHLGNGAHLERIHLWANRSQRGMSDSYGIMVNYEYDLPSIERNHESFLSDGTIKTSAQIKKLHRKKA
ncbi:MCD, Malonyl-CoA decarboxylase MCD [Alginatibacterium sediminis]|uniref:MCD, Malonyl-CoA decarboxylase MCD n=1 Tax=Alginatibacterium sediminis TaxID=2164068 RepID=A0A420E733_9ALTE|nr:malonyl-CoA decarboxylase [Alginatibacterium sediminis]RKF14362.1 MCD, Malonyl-CoA decarboxylase MCD [Alginatibacterium sediminis]